MPDFVRADRDNIVAVHLAHIDDVAGVEADGVCPELSHVPGVLTIARAAVAEVALGGAKTGDAIGHAVDDTGERAQEPAPIRLWRRRVLVGS